MATDPWLPARLKADADLVAAEQALEQAVREALQQWLGMVRHLVLGDPLTAAAEPYNPDGFAAAGPTWDAAVRALVEPLLSDLFGEQFLAFARTATISAVPYWLRYIDQVFSRLKLFPAAAFEEIRPEIAEAIDSGETIDQIRDRIAASFNFDEAADAPGTRDHERTRELRGRINQLEKQLDDPALDPSEVVALRAERRALYEELHMVERRWQWKARRIARTEVIGAYNAGAFAGATARAEILEEPMAKRWLATADERTRPTHQDADDQLRRLEAPFVVGGAPLMFPGDPTGPAHEIIQCRCTLLVHAMDELDDDERDRLDSPIEDAPQQETVTAAGGDMDDNRDDHGSGLPSGWRGMLCPLDVPTGDGRILATPPGGLRLRTPPNTLLWQRELGHGHDGAVIAGRIDRTWVDSVDGVSVVMGEGPFDLGGEHGAEAARLLGEGYFNGVSVDVDDVTATERWIDGDGREVDTDGMDEDDFWEAWESGTIRPIMVMSDWRLMGATLTSQPAFDEARIEPIYDYEPVDAITASVIGATSLPVAERDHPWDGDAAVTRVFEAYTDGDNQVDTSAVARAFLYRDPDADPATKAAYKLPFADWIGDQLQIVPAGVSATAGGHGVDAADIPDEDKDAIRDKICTLYGKISKAYADWPECPFDGMQASGALDDLAVWPAADFADPQLPGPTPLTVSPDGTVRGHLATWRTCHTSFPDACVTPPRSTTGYALFHLGEVLTDEGLIPVGKVTLGGGHADPKVGVRGATEHYDDTGYAVAAVRAGEDEHGIWLAGRLLGDVTPGQIEELMRSPLSGDWRRVNGNLELVAALAVNVPGFPIPRTVAASAAPGVPVSLVAAGVVRRPRPPRSGAPALDFEGFARAVAREVAAQIRAAQQREQRAQALAHRIGRDPQTRALRAAARIGR